MAPELQPLANHLWQSTLFAVAAGLLTLVMKNNRARIRYALWFAASAKFLIPFSILAMTGSLLAPARPPEISRPRVLPVVEQISEPFAAAVPAASLPAASNRTAPVLIGVWAIGFAMLVCARWRAWRQIRAALQNASPLDLSIGVPVMSSPAFFEPGVLGIRRPVLLLPDGVEDHLTPAQLDAVLAHELCHVRRRDNLTAALHMAVEAVFWFHPLVWWIGTRLIEERERACDEAVLQGGNQPEVYAEGILKICERYVESPVACVAGVTGANLRKRIEAIMSNRIAFKLNFARRALLAAAGIAALAGPMLFGVLNAPSLRAQSTIVGAPGQPRPSFEVASVKWIDKTKMQRNHEGHLLTPERFVDRTELMQYISAAYIRGDFCTLKSALGVDCPLIAGSIPGWARTERFEIQATLPSGIRPEYTARQTRQGNTAEVDLMLQVLLEDRFQLRVHREMRELPVYLLTAGKNGPKLKNSAAGSEMAKAADGSLHEGHGFRGSRRIALPDGGARMRLDFMASTTAEAADFLAENLDRPVLDRTGLTGDYDFQIEYDEEVAAPDLSGLPTTARGNPLSFLGRVTVSSLSAALQAVGLQLEPAKAPIEVLVIDHVERPSEN